MIKNLLLILSLSLLAGCVQKPLVTVNALSSGQSVGKKFLIIPASQELWNTKQIEYTQIATVVAASLSSQGYTQVKDEKLADQVILLNFLRSGAISNTRNVTIPIYGQTGVSSATTYGNSNTTFIVMVVATVQLIPLERQQQFIRLLMELLARITQL
ncbi:hypothetical protein [Escherichia coli]|uniref:hypothetical protein n=1 Tax=Escherichia coli TaxID=562 RepID=UPI0020D0932A|nr:hypothetical protein [Escherichia coli]MCP8781504.1 hypothetical protein [Escherichia coli]